MQIELISLGLTAIGGFASLIWRISKTEEQIKQLIDRQNVALLTEISRLNHELEKLHLTNENDHENFNYRDHSIEEALRHKCRRLESWIYQIASHLEKKDDFFLNKASLGRFHEQD